MDDYVRESFIELMQRGIEVDVWPTNDVRVLWLSVNRDCLFVGLSKQSIAKQELYLNRMRIIQNGDEEDKKRLEIATDDFSLKFNVDTMASRDILIRNLIKLVDHYKDTVDRTRSEYCMESTGTPQLISAWSVFHAIGTKRGQQSISVIGMGLLMIASFMFQITHFGMVLGVEIGLGCIGACMVLTTLIIEVFHAVSPKSGKHSPKSGKYSPTPDRSTPKIAAWLSGPLSTKKMRTAIHPEFTHAAAP